MFDSIKTENSYVYPYLAVSVPILPYKIRLLNAAVDMKLLEQDFGTKDAVPLQSDLVYGDDALKLQIAIKLALFPYQLVGAEALFLYKVGQPKRIDLSVAGPMGITTEAYVNWLDGQGFIPIVAERIFRLLILTAIAERLPEISAYTTLPLDCPIAKRNLESYPIVVATPTIDNLISRRQDNWVVSIIMDEVQIAPPKDEATVEKPSAPTVAQASRRSTNDKLADDKTSIWSASRLKTPPKVPMKVSLNKKDFVAKKPTKAK